MSCAANVNNQGMTGQLAFLSKELGGDEKVKAMLRSVFCISKDAPVPNKVREAQEAFLEQQAARGRARLLYPGKLIRRALALRATNPNLTDDDMAKHFDLPLGAWKNIERERYARMDPDHPDSHDVVRVDVTVRVEIQLPLLTPSDSLDGPTQEQYDDLAAQAIAECDYSFGPDIDLPNGCKAKITHTEIIDDGTDDVRVQ